MVSTHQSRGDLCAQLAGGSDLQAFLIVFVVVICVRTSPDPPTHRSSFYVSSHVGTEICARQMLGNNICLHAPTVTTDHPYSVGSVSARVLAVSSGKGHDV